MPPYANAYLKLNPRDTLDWIKLQRIMSSDIPDHLRQEIVNHCHGLLNPRDTLDYIKLNKLTQYQRGGRGNGGNAAASPVIDRQIVSLQGQITSLHRKLREKDARIVALEKDVRWAAGEIVRHIREKVELQSHPHHNHSSPLKPEEFLRDIKRRGLSQAEHVMNGKSIPAGQSRKHAVHMRAVHLIHEAINELVREARKL